MSFGFWTELYFLINFLEFWKKVFNQSFTPTVNCPDRLRTTGLLGTTYISLTPSSSRWTTTLDTKKNIETKYQNTTNQYKKNYSNPTPTRFTKSQAYKTKNYEDLTMFYR